MADVEIPPPHAGQTRNPGGDRLAFLRIGMAILVVVVSAFALWALRGALSPFILAVFLLLLIGGLEGALSRHTPLGTRMALPAAIIVVVTLFGVSMWLMVRSGAMIGRDANLYVTRLDALMQMGAQKLGLGAAPTIDKLFHQLDPSHYIAEVAKAVGGVAENTFLVLIYLGFLLASRAGFGQKLSELFEDSRHAEALLILGRIQRGIESYIWVQALAGVMVAAGSAAVMAAMGQTHVVFWSFTVFLVNFIPAIGLVIGVVGPTLFALVELDALWKVAVVFAGMEIVHFVVGHVIMPRMQGRSLNIDPLVVLLSLAFWGTIFGPAGVFLSTPLTVIVMTICAEFPATRGIAVVLSADGKPFSGRSPEPIPPGS